MSKKKNVEAAAEEAVVAEEVVAEEVAVEELKEGGPVELTLTFAPEVPSRNIRVAIKSLEFRPRGKSGSYRSGAAYVLEAKEALELVDAGIASVLEDPCALDLTFPTPDPVEE